VAITEKQRHDLFTKFEETLGPEHAATMMELLPPVGWADVATKQDLHALESHIDARFAAVDARFAAVDARFDSVATKADVYRIVMTAMSVQTAVIGLLLLVSR
jgi:hypothetical protein